MRLYLMRLLLLFLMLITHLPSFSQPTLIRDVRQDPSDFTYAVGPMFKYKRMSGPDNFGGDMGMWGLRFSCGKLRDPSLGIMYMEGHLNGHSQKFELSKLGLTLEDSFREDSRVSWRLTFGKGDYLLKQKISGRTVYDGSFVFAEPLITGLLPLSRHIALEFGAGYTFAGATGVRIEGLTLNVELLFGRL